MDRLLIEYSDVNRLRPADANARTHSAKQIEQIARSIDVFGFNNPVLVDGEGRIIAGHGRVAAARLLGLSTVPTVRLDHMTPAQRRAYILADNKLAENAGWDEQILAIELQELIELDPEFEITITGFDMPEIDLLLDPIAPAGHADPADAAFSFDAVPVVARPGDLWSMGDHLLFCGDALDPLSYEILLAGERAEMVFADPPYNVPIAGNVSGLGKARHGEFAMASGEMTPAQFVTFLADSMALAARHSHDGALHFICIDWRHVRELLDASATIYSETKNICVWVKTNGGMGSLYRSQHEMVGVFKVGKRQHINNVKLGRYGRNRTNVWSYAGMTSFQNGREESLQLHPTVKPVALVEDALYDCSNRGGIVLDMFGGSGTTLLAAERAGRRGRVIELDPHFVDVALYRFATCTGIAPINLANGETYELPAATRTGRQLLPTGGRRRQKRGAIK